ncbi:autoinducer binding domain-containing protein [Pseudomonas sp. S75]|uniref:autoinducer binding domain-containing protein n=1 Tax=unclassified Pseudomonas TaxID=196821 RepID=UPI0019033638|nr:MULTISPECIES: autoinducer binding domain-containing protein [unclassified Pseudomonas]MBJ9974801.1 autoinducer binding domain-containing protein [Pseudomonas sp. S30]MBK0152443.1 autoinducer binding domain-containing protein [Pseudomonas sp. S75]
MQWMGDLLSAVYDAHDSQTLLDEVQAAARHLGFDYCAYGLRAPLPVTRPRIVMLSNYQRSWCEHYHASGYLLRDPTVLHCQRSMEPVVWGDEVFAGAPQLWDEARHAGLNHGWAQSCLEGRNGGGMLTLARSAEAIGESELRAHEPRMRWLVNVAHQGFSRMLTDTWQPKPKAPLSEREREVLRWAADGKTLNEVADILTLSIETVKFHTRNAALKLGAANRTAAVARAALMGMLG